jgi:hypothetical protein
LLCNKVRKVWFIFLKIGAPLVDMWCKLTYVSHKVNFFLLILDLISNIYLLCLAHMRGISTYFDLLNDRRFLLKTSLIVSYKRLWVRHLLGRQDTEHFAIVVDDLRLV